MKLIVHELQDWLFQEITVGQKTLHVAAIRPRLYLHNKPAGTITVQIWDQFNKLVATSSAATITGLQTLNYAHGLYRFLIEAALRAGEVYRIALVAGGGYSFSESAYVGWCNGWDMRQDAGSYSPSDSFNAPLDMEIWERKTVLRGVA